MSYSITVETRTLPDGGAGFLVIGRAGDEIIEITEAPTAIAAHGLLCTIHPEFTGAEVTEGVEFLHEEAMDARPILYLAEENLTIRISSEEAAEFYANGTHYEGLRGSDCVRTF